MNYLSGINRNAATAWSPDSSVLAMGSKAGSTNANFDTSSLLESFGVNRALNDATLLPLEQMKLSDRVHSLSWGKGGSRGIIAAGLPDGSISLVDGAAIMGEELSFSTEIFSNPSKHSTPVYCTEFNTLQPTVMASGSENSEVFIWNLAKPETPVAYSPGTGVNQNNSPVTDLQWNGVLPHILATVTQTSHVVIWDLRNKRPAVQFTDRSGRIKNCKTLSWNPVDSMQLVTASEDDNSPVIEVWNLRNTQMPISVLEGHTQGVWSTSWSKHDSSLLLSAGKESTALCWNVEKNTVVQRIPLRSEWNSSIEWSPVDPAAFSLASYQGSVGVYSVTDVQGKQTGENTFSRDHAPPSWLSRPASATFGFGGKLLTVKGSEVTVQSFVSDNDLVEKAKHLQTVSSLSLEEQKNFCIEKSQGQEEKEDQETWQFMAAQFDSDSRNATLKVLGFDKEEARLSIQNIVSKSVDKKPKEPLEKEEVKEEIPTEETPNEEEPVKRDEEDVSNLFGDEGGDPFGESSPQDNPFGFPDSQDDPFSSIHESSQTTTVETTSNNEGDLSSIIHMAGRANFNLRYMKDSTENEKILVHNLMHRNFSEAVEVCFRMNKPADALAIAAASGSPELQQKTQATYISSLPKTSYLHLLEKISSNKLKELVAHADVEEWKCTLAVLCSHAGDEQFSSLCSDLGDLLAHCGDFHAANLCYITGHNLDKALELWERKDEGERISKLQKLMERICLLRGVSSGDSLGTLAVRKYCEYAELLASQGELDSALSFISNLNSNSSPAQSLLQRLTGAVGSTTKVPSSSSLSSRNPPASTQLNVRPASKPIATGAFTRSTQSTQFYQQNSTPSNYPAQTGNGFPARTGGYPGQAGNGFPAQTGGFPSQTGNGYQPPVNTLITPSSVTAPVNTYQPPTGSTYAPVPQTSTPVPAAYQQPPVNTFKPTPVTARGSGPVPAPAILNPYNPVPSVNQAPPAGFNPTENKPAMTNQIAQPEPVAPGKVEIAHELWKSIQEQSQKYASNTVVSKSLSGCGKERIDLLEEKLRKNTLSPETVDYLERFVQNLSQGNSVGLIECHAWLTKNKYSELGAKIMLGLKKIIAASKNF